MTIKKLFLPGHLPAFWHHEIISGGYCGFSGTDSTHVWLFQGEVVIKERIFGIMNVLKCILYRKVGSLVEYSE